MGRAVSDHELVHRFAYHAPGLKTREIHENLRVQFKDLALSCNSLLPKGEDKKRFFRKLEEASYVEKGA